MFHTATKILFFSAVILISTSTASANQPIYGTSSFYTVESCKREGTSGVFTASGERFDENALTCAIGSYKFGKKFRVTNLENGKSVIVRHNDFGPNKKLRRKGRIIDLSKGAFRRIADLKHGLIKVKVEVVK